MLLRTDEKPTDSSAVSSWLNEDRAHLKPGLLFFHGGVVRFCGEPAGGIKNFGQKTQVADRGEMDAGTRQNPMNRFIDIVLFAKWFVPGGTGSFAAPPGATSNRFDR